MDGPGWLGRDSRMGLDTIAVDVARGGAGVDGPNWLDGDSRMGLDTFVVDVARGGAGVEVVAIGGDVSGELEMYVKLLICVK